jgi:excisionase family DNA binding protein
MSDESFRSAPSVSAMLDVRAVAVLLGCSPRHVYRLSDTGRIPAPTRLGGLVRWNRAAVEAWIDAGCPDLRDESRKGAGHA